MHAEERDLLEILKSEMEFLEQGGYAHPPGRAWRPSFVFEDSPTCINFGSLNNLRPCSECPLIEFVPAELRSERVPCRHISVTPWGETLDMLYRTSDQHEIELVVLNWLRETISKLEQRRAEINHPEAPSAASGAESRSVVALQQDVYPKCANPACPTEFHWLAGGKFFRFRPDAVEEGPGEDAERKSGNLHGVKHYWLCEACSRVFTLVYDEGFGVSLKVVQLDLPLAELSKELPAA
jgi:hypothetical protein